LLSIKVLWIGAIRPFREIVSRWSVECRFGAAVHIDITSVILTPAKRPTPIMRAKSWALSILLPHQHLRRDFGRFFGVVQIKVTVLARIDLF
jgi:hypothetical protein